MSANAGAANAVNVALHMHTLPPFYTLQPVPATLETQLQLWGQLIASYTAAVAATRGCCCALRFEHDSPIFNNKRIGRRLGAEGTAAVLEHAVHALASQSILLLDAPPMRRVVVASLPIVDLFERVASWVRAQGQLGTGTAAVHTIDELVAEDAMGLQGPSSPSLLLPSPLSPVDNAASPLMGAAGVAEAVEGACAASPAAFRLTPEELLRVVLNEFSSGRRRGGASGTRVALFNLDGSATAPFEGAKFTMST